MVNKTTVNYIDKKAFLEAIIAYKAKCKKAAKAKKPKPKISDYIANCLMLIAENVARKPCYSNYTFRDIMVSDAIENCIRYFDNFDPNHPSKNPFGYFTQYCIYAFSRRIWLEKKELYTKYKMAQQSGVLDDAEVAELEENGEDNIQQGQLYDNISEFIGKFEKNLDKAKAKTAKAKKGVERFVDE